MICVLFHFCFADPSPVCYDKFNPYPTLASATGEKREKIYRIELKEEG